MLQCALLSLLLLSHQSLLLPFFAPFNDHLFNVLENIDCLQAIKLSPLLDPLSSLVVGLPSLYAHSVLACLTLIRYRQIVSLVNHRIRRALNFAIRFIFIK